MLAQLVAAASRHLVSHQVRSCVKEYCCLLYAKRRGRPAVMPTLQPVCSATCVSPSVLTLGTRPSAGIWSKTPLS